MPLPFHGVFKGLCFTYDLCIVEPSFFWLCRNRTGYVCKDAPRRFASGKSAVTEGEGGFEKMFLKKRTSSIAPPARLWQTRKYSVDYFLRACPVFWTRQTPHYAISVEKVERMDEWNKVFYKSHSFNVSFQRIGQRNWIHNETRCTIPSL